MKFKQIFWQIIAGLFFLGSLITLLFFSPQGLLQKINWLGSSVCHQLSQHSFQLDGVQFPLCSRCTGTYLSAFIGLIYLGLKGKRFAVPKKNILFLFILFFLFWAIDGINSFSRDVFNHTLLYTPSNLLRFFSGIGMGMVFSLVIMTIFNMVSWEKRAAGALVDSWKELGLLLLCESILLLFPFNKNMVVFNLAGIISTLTVLILIGVLYSILIIIIFHREGRYRDWKDLFVPLAFGFGMAFLQVILMVNLRTQYADFVIFPV